MRLDTALWRRSAGTGIGLYQKRRFAYPTSLSATFLVLAALYLAAHPHAVLSQVKAPAAIVVGATVSVTGPFSSEVAPFKKMMETWAEMVNAKGGIFFKHYEKRLPLKFIIYDDSSKPAEAERLYEKLASTDKVDLLLGPFSSPITMTASTVAEKHKIPFIATAA